MAIIELHGLTKNYGKIVAASNIDLKIKEGEIFGLLGPNGAGKTTTIKMLATLLEPTSGTAKVNGFDILKQQAKVRESIGIVFQEPSSDELLTGYENLRLHAMMYDIPDSEIEKRIKESLDLVELTDRKDDLVKKYSGGMRRRLEIARGMMHRPKILFLDEPTLGLDPRGRETMWDYVKRLKKEYKITILLTTHYMEEADELADRVCIIDHGKIVAVDTPDALKKTLGGDIINIQMDSPNAKALKGLKYICNAEAKKNTLVLTVKNAPDHLQEILRKLGKVKSVEVRSPTLGDVFMRFTGRGIEQAEGGWFEKAMQASTNKD